MKKKLILCLVSLLLLALLAGCELPFGLGGNKEEASEEFVIATKNTTEQNILANIAKLLIETKTKHTVAIRSDAEDTSATLLADAAGDKVAIYFDYVTSIYVNGMGRELAEANVATIGVSVEDLLWDDYQLTVAAKIGYNGGMSLFMLPARRSELGSPSSVRELGPIAGGMISGMDEAFDQRPDGFDAFCAAYGMTFKDAIIYNAKDGFDALVRGKIDVMVGDSVTPYYALYDLYALEDNKPFFPISTTLAIISPEIANEYGDVQSALHLMDGLLDGDGMSDLVVRVEMGHQTVEEVVKSYLRLRNLI